MDSVKPNIPSSSVNQGYSSGDEGEGGEDIRYSPASDHLNMDNLASIPGLAAFLQMHHQKNGGSTSGMMSPAHFTLPKPRPRPAIVVQGGKKSYGKFEVLQNINMHVPERSIYGLLGSSGCGKTTLLSCLVGLRKMNAGNIYICGEKPGTPASGVPGKRVGYMPQEVALNAEFTIKEVCHYFGRIYGMDVFKIHDRIDYLVNLLDLKRCRGQIKDMSGGQQRRVSFVVALLHEPEILILDEPTVGVDPVLRANIWKHLRDLVEKFGTTILITTHYIEEMRQADTVGIMRNGLLMAEDSPSRLLELHNAPMLEDVVLKFCLKDSDQDSGIAGFQPSKNRMDPFSIDSPQPQIMPAYGDYRDGNGQSYRNSNLNDITTKASNRLNALIRKNVLVMMRNVWFLLFVFTIPSLIVVIFCVAIGSDPIDLPLGVINNDFTGNCSPGGFSSCNATELSCRFLNVFDTKLVELIPIQDEEEARDLVAKRKLWGYIEFPKGFSEHMFARTLGKPTANFNDTIYGSQISFKLDMATIAIGLTIKKLVFDAFREFSQGLLEVCDVDATGRDLPLVFREPFYGTEDGTLTDFVAPGTAMGFLFFMGALTCGLAYIIEKKDGMLNRTLVAGVTTMEIVMGHLLTQFAVVIVQAIIAFVIMFVVFDIPKIGSPVLAFAITILNSIAGMSVGFLGAAVCDEEKNAMLMAIGAVLPNFLLAGVIWPFESLPPAFQIIGYFLPGTLANKAARSILLRGLGMSSTVVWLGFASTTGWIIVYQTLTFLIHKLRSRSN